MEQHTDRERKLYDILRKYWGYDAFRGCQLDVINSVLDGKDTLALMPTGAGKSATYQIPGLVKDGVCIVITPLIALMKDQVDSLRRRGISAVAIHSGQSTRHIDLTLDNCVYGDVKFLFVSPERVASDTFMIRLGRMKVSLIAVDEAHCISQWGYDFRPSYLRISQIRDVVPNVPVLALTASATGEVAEDVMQKLRFGEKIMIRSDFSRPNLSYTVRHTDDKKGQLMRVLTSVAGSGIVYMRSREGVERLAAELLDEGVSASYYHAGLPYTERNARQQDWTTGRTRVIVATTAFGMGIDKPDVRFVVHYDVCDSLEEYYQEAGRAGRDGRRSYAVMLVGSDEKGRVAKRLENEFPAIDKIKDIYNKIHNYLQVGVGEGKHYSFAFNLYDFCARNKMWAGTVMNAVKILQQNGYMVFTAEEENPARIMFCVSRDDLYSLRVSRDDLDHIIRTLLRLYTGVFTDYRPIDTQELAIYTGYTEERVKELLKTLWQLRVIRYIPKNHSPMLFLMENRLPEKDIYISPQTYAMRKEMAARRIETIVEYIENEEECRSLFIQEYFGQDDAVPCGVCDNCIERRRREKAAAGDADKYENLSGKILKAVSDGGLPVNELVAKIEANPQIVIEALDKLAHSGKISISASGIITIKR